MGQYHHPVCIEAEEGLDPADMDTGLKEGEQGFNRPSTPNAIVALVCARGGNMPADCSQSPLIGRWAGQRVLIRGDYAEDDDIPGWKGPRLSKLYRAMRPVEDRKPKKDWRTTPVFDGYHAGRLRFPRSRLQCPLLRARTDLQGWRPSLQDLRTNHRRWTSIHSVQVKPVARHFGNCGIAEYVIDSIYDARDLEYLKRCGMKPGDVQRPPRSADWNGFLPEEISEGQHRLIVNLDTLEYVDPVKFGQIPTLAGMISLAPKHRDLPILKKANQDNLQIVDVAGGVFVMLCHPKRRGGGDIPANAEALVAAVGEKDSRAKAAKLFKGVEDVKGRWRGGRILGTSEIRYEAWPTTEEVLERGTDISDKVLKYLVAISHY